MLRSYAHIVEIDHRPQLQAGGGGGYYLWHAVISSLRARQAERQ